MLSVKTFATGKLQGTIYDFLEINDELAEHEHDETTNHITIVARGSFRAHGRAWQKELHQGEVVDWEPNDPHAFKALEPNSRLVNIRK